MQIASSTIHIACCFFLLLPVPSLICSLLCACADNSDRQVLSCIMLPACSMHNVTSAQHQSVSGQSMTLCTVTGDGSGCCRRPCLLHQLPTDQNRGFSSLQGAQQAHANLQAAVHHTRAVREEQLPSELAHWPSSERPASKTSH